MKLPLSSQLAGVQLRFSRLCDAQGIVELLGLRDVSDDGVPSLTYTRGARVQSTEDVKDLIQTSYMSISATALAPPHAGGEEGEAGGSRQRRREMVVGFLALGAAPRLFEVALPTSRGGDTDAAGDSPAFPPDRWEQILHGGLFAGRDVDSMQPSNTLWANFLVAPSSSTAATVHPSTVDAVGEAPKSTSYSAARLVQEMVAVALSVAYRTAHVLWPLPSSSCGGMEAVLTEALAGHVLPMGMSAARPKGFSFKGTLLHVRREDVIPALAMRPGRIEDYDDFVPLLVRGAGVVTGLPDDFFLEELLKDQTDTQKVGIAEDPVTHEVVGLTCAHVLTPEEQQSFTRQYALEPFHKLRPLGTTGRKSRAGLANTNATTARIDFLYYNEAYGGSAHEMVHYLFETMFPACEYLVVTLPHAQAETPVLRCFTYVPMRQYQPHSSRGEHTPVPPGLWVCCRHSALGVAQFRATAIRTAEERMLAEEFLRQPSQPGLKEDVTARLQEDLCVSHEKDRIEERALTMRLPNTTVFRLTAASGEIVGVVSARRMLGKDVYALKANYDLDEYLSLHSHTGKDYAATNISEKKAKRVAPELHGVMVRAMYVKPVYHTWIRFLVREVLRGYAADIAFVLTPLEEEGFAPLMHELITARPRRVVEAPREKDEDTEELGENEEGEGGAGHSCLSSNAAPSIATATTTTVPSGDVATLASLHFTTCRFLSDEKHRVHTRVVVVGASATSVAFLHALLTTPFALFTNLVLISVDGLPPHPNQEPTLWRADHLELMEREYLALQQGSPMRVVPGALVDVDKVNRFVTVDNGTFEPYDFLVLASGRQYVLPPSVRQVLQQEGRTGKKSVIPLNGELARDRVRQALAEIDVNTSNVANVMVYGSGLDALAVAAAMVEENFSPQRVVVCAREASLPPYMDEATYHATSTLFRAIGVNVFRGYDISRMEFDDENRLSNVLLAPVSSESKAGQSMELACCLVVCVEDKDIDANVLSTLNKRSIVFDGRVIVNRRYRTTDPYIFAAGPVAMWTRRYGTATPNFEDFDAKDVGQHLAQVMLGHVGFDEFRRLSARTGKRAVMDRLNGGTCPSGSVEDDDATASDEEEEDDRDWNNANGNTAGAASSSLGMGTGAEGTSAAGTADPAVGGGGVERASPSPSAAGAHTAHHGVANAQLRKKLPSYLTPVARRVRLPRGYHFFSVQCVDAKWKECCEALTCNAVDPDRFSDYSAVLSPVSGHVAATEEEETESESTAGSKAAWKRCSEQCVITLYVNHRSRRVDGVTYFGLDNPPAGNLRALVGLPETLLNVVYRYREAERRASEWAAAAAAAPKNGSSNGAQGPGGADTVNLPAHSRLTAGVRCGRLDLLEYLRLPHLQTIFYDRFGDFFRLLEYRSRMHEEAIKMRERILAQHKLDSSLTPEQIAAYQAELTAQRSGFRYEVQLALIAFLHEHKNFRPQNMYLPDVEGVVAARRAAAGQSLSGITRSPAETVR